MNLLNCFSKGNRYNLISTDDDSCDDIIAAFIASGIKNGYKCIYFMDDLSFGEVEYFLKNYKLNLTELIASRQLDLRSAMEFYIEKKMFIDIENIQKLVNEVISDGYPGVAIISDRSCFYEKGLNDEMLYIFERNMRDFYKDNPVQTLTNYNIDKFGVDTVFALTHINPHFLYKRDGDVYVYDKEKDIFSKEETLGIVFNFLKNREKLMGENKIYQFISELSSEISYKKEEMEILETTLNSICKYSRADYGIIAMLKDNHIDDKKMAVYKIPNDLMAVCREYSDNRNTDDFILSKSFEKVNYLIIKTDDLKGYPKEILLRHNISLSLVLPLRNNKKIYGYIWLGTQKLFVSFEGNADFLYRSCERIAKMITESRRYKRIQDTLLQAREMKALGELTGGIVHEFNNVLTPILGYTQIMKDKIDDPTLSQYINLIENSAMDGAKIVKRIQEYAKIKKKIKEPVDIDKEIVKCFEITKPRWTSESQIQRKFIDVKFELKSGCIIDGVPTEVREIFVNLISNAVDAMPKGGTIKVKSYNDNDEVVIKISDDGIGMDDEVKRKIFEPFFTTKNERGNGLGLPIVMNIINDMGGNIEVESEKDRGTEFIIRIPVSASIIKTNVLKPVGHETKKIKILVIDDQEAVAKTVCEMLKTVGHEAVYSTNEKEAFDIFEKNDFDCILCDLAMPESTGIQLSEKFGKLKKDVPFILMTGWLGKLKESNLRYVNEIIQKPFTMEEISDAVNRVAGRPIY